ncbi:MAG: hypothetical protein V8R46_08900 [Eubacterium ramulus]
MASSSDQIDQKKVELAQAESDLAAAKREEAEQYDAMKNRIRYMYENGDSSFLDAFVGAQSFADVFNKERISPRYMIMIVTFWQNIRIQRQKLQTL